MKLVLAEKPSVARDLAAVMDPSAKRGEGCLQGTFATWTWALGHLGELAPPEHYVPGLAGRWTLEALPVIPDTWALQPREGKDGAAAKQLAIIKGLLRKAESVIVATDAGREGELIWFYVRALCMYSGPVQRLWLSENTPAAVRAAFAALRPAQTALEAAARARAQADWLVGMNATMALSARHGGLWSAGRVQTPTLALLVSREAEIEAFTSEAYHVVRATFEAEGDGYSGQWFHGDEDRVASAAEADAVATKVRGQKGRVASIERKRAQEAPPRLFNLTDLQRAANTQRGMTAAATLAAAQALYEAGLLTYPRTDSRHVTPEVASTFPARLQALAGHQGVGVVAQRLAAQGGLDPGKRVIDASRVTDHHALLPTVCDIPKGGHAIGEKGATSEVAPR